MEIISQPETEVLMQQGYGGGGKSRNNIDPIAAQRKLANNARMFDAIDKGKENTGKNSGFASFSRTATEVTARAEKRKVAGAKGALTKAKMRGNKELIASTTQKLKDVTAKPVSAASSRYVTKAPKKPAATKAKAKAKAESKPKARRLNAKKSKKVTA